MTSRRPFPPPPPSAPATLDRRRQHTCSSRRDTSSSSCGREVASILSFAAASSIKSIALSGRKRSLMYRSERLAAATSAESSIAMPWCASYLVVKGGRKLMRELRRAAQARASWGCAPGSVEAA